MFFKHVFCEMHNEKQIGPRRERVSETQLNSGEIWAKSFVNKTNFSEFGGRVVGAKSMLHARVIAQFKCPHGFYKNTLLFEHFLFMTISLPVSLSLREKN